uniref:HAT C-terminal dimerisation domain-containing protein n=1 Tax=Fagus sylvatica TaxID=28930 RepID=A0A2N9EIN3_FAGSY
MQSTQNKTKIDVARGVRQTATTDETASTELSCTSSTDNRRCRSPSSARKTTPSTDTALQAAREFLDHRKQEHPSDPTANKSIVNSEHYKQMDASSNPNPNEPNPPIPTDPIIIPDEPTLPTESQPVPSNTKQSKELTSKVWEHFTKLGGGNPEEPRATYGLKDIHESIAKVRNAVRWNSTYLMLEAAEKFERAFDRLIIDGNGKKPKDPPYSLDWENARLLCNFLRLLYEATLRFSRSLIVTSNSYFHELVGIQNELYKLCNLDGDSLLKSMAEGASGRSSCVTSDVVSSSMSSASDTHDPWKSVVEEFQHHLAQEDSGECKIEVDQYLSEASEPPCALGFDILGWWRVNSSKYKIISHVARDVMAVPVSTVAFESTFSTGGRVLDSFRSSLSPLTVEALICCQNWLRSTSSPVKLREAMDEVQSIDEELESELPKVNTDV